MLTNNRFARLALAACLFMPLLAHAHTGIGSASGFLSGIAHPIGGPDHLLAMVAIGIWAAQMGRCFIWAVPLAFVSAMALGGMLGIIGIPVPFGEQGIVVSLLLLGILIAAAIRLPLAASVAIAGLFAVFHGHAHGAEMPESASGIAYGFGFILATAALHGCGIGFGLLMQRISWTQLTRASGAAIAIFGGYWYLAA
jgi:urease accessory protein